MVVIETNSMMHDNTDINGDIVNSGSNHKGSSSAIVAMARIVMLSKLKILITCSSCCYYHYGFHDYDLCCYDGGCIYHLCHHGCNYLFMIMLTDYCDHDGYYPCCCFGYYIYAHAHVFPFIYRYMCI